MAFSSYAVLIDVGFLRASGAEALNVRASQVRLDAGEIADWSRSLADRERLVSGVFVRAYWYDAVFHVGHPSAKGQREFLDKVGQTPGIRLRLGHISEYRQPTDPALRKALRKTAKELGVGPERLINEFQRHWEFRPERRQKGVDTLITLDLVQLAEQGLFDTAVLISGDRDLAEAVRTAQDLGAHVVAATPNRQSVARELSELVDGVIELDRDTLGRMFTVR